MYAWLWRHLPGGLPGKLAGCLGLLVGALALLYYVVFPWADPRLPWNSVNVDHVATTPATPGPSATASP